MYFLITWYILICIYIGRYMHFFFKQSYTHCSLRTSWCCCRNKTRDLFWNATLRIVQVQSTHSTPSALSSSSTLYWCAQWPQVSSFKDTHIQAQSVEWCQLTLFFHKQTTGPSLCSPCRITELRSMNWWPRQCLNRECKCCDCKLLISDFFSLFFFPLFIFCLILFLFYFPQQYLKLSFSHLFFLP